MLQTIEAILEPSGEVRLLEAVRVSGPTRALLTILETPNQEHRGNAAALLNRLRNNPVTPECRRGEHEIDQQIQHERNAWE